MFSKIQTESLIQQIAFLISAVVLYSCKERNFSNYFSHATVIQELSWLKYKFSHCYLISWYYKNKSTHKALFFIILRIVSNYYNMCNKDNKICIYHILMIELYTFILCILDLFCIRSLHWVFTSRSCFIDSCLYWRLLSP